MLALFDGRNPVASWETAVIVLLVVTGVVFLLLNLIIIKARQIAVAVAEVWAQGQRVANNTIHIAALYRTRDALERILGRAGRVAASVKAVEAYAKGAAGTPASGESP